MSEKNVLDGLPVLVLGDCQKCGAKHGEYSACNVDDNGKVTDCNQCEKRKQ